MQHPESSLSDASSSAGTSATASGMMRSSRIGMPQRQRPVPGGPRRPSTKPSLPSVSSRLQLQTQPHRQQNDLREEQQQRHEDQRQGQRQQSQYEQERHPEHRLSKNDQPPSYLQSQHDSQSQRHSYTPPPTSAVTSDSSCSHPPMSVFTRADTPSSMSAFSPARTMSPVPGLEPLGEQSPPRQSSPPVASTSIDGSSEPVTQATERVANSGVPSISKPPTPAPESPIPTNAHTKPRMVTAVPLPAPLQPPPSIDFNPVPIAWKGLTLDAAQWTFSSAELQQIVSSAIRASAEPSSIHLLPLQVHDIDLVQEVERLESERAQATAQYRFTMHRRNMLLQSLNASGSSISPSTACSANTINLSQGSASSPATDLAQRLAEASGTLDRLAVSIVRVSDQLAQIRALRDVHSASALAVALRKLNASYARRVREVESLKEKLAATEEERDEAWRVAEELAVEYDGEFDETGEVNVVNGERAVAVAATLTRASRVGTKIKVPGVGPRIQQPQTDAEVGENITGTEGEGQQGPVPESMAACDGSPSSAPGESTSETSALSPIPRRKRANSAASRVTAARTRSLRASKASLRFPRKHNESRPPSTYSQSSAHSGHGRSRSRANSITSLRDSSPTSANPHGGTEGSIPDVPKIPSATELARLASVKSTSSSITPTGTAAVPPLPPPPPPPIETSSSKIGSFLDMMTRPNSATDEKGKSPEKASPPEEENRDIDTVVEGMEALSASDAQEGEGFKPAGDAQTNGGAAGADIETCVDRGGQVKEADGTSAKDDGSQVITFPSRLPPHQAPFSASRVETSTTANDPEFAEVSQTKKQMSMRPSLTVYPPSWTRPPPDSPVDVTHGSGPHRADNGDDDDVFDDENEDELADVLESAYSRSQLQIATRGRFAHARSPLRMQHAQSMLPFPGTGATPAGRTLNGDGGDNSMKRSPASDNQISLMGQGMESGSGGGPFRGLAASASARRPTSLPSAQRETKPWDYI